MNPNFRIDLSPLDEERFGIRSARASNMSTDSLQAVFDFCNTHQVKFLIVRCSTLDLSTTQAMEQAGFRIMDTLIYYHRDLKASIIFNQDNSHFVRPVRTDEADIVRRVAIDTFQNYGGHYHADPRLSRVKCDETYASWAERSVIMRTTGSEVLVAEDESGIIGLATLRMNSPEEGEGLLFGVTPRARGRRVYSSLMNHAMDWCQSKGAQRMIISTQITNLTSQRTWIRCGFEPTYSYYTFHRWFDE